MRGARLEPGASIPSSIHPSIPSRRWPRAAESGWNIFSAAFLGGNLKVSPAPLPGPPWVFGGIILHNPRRSGRVSPGWVAAPERSMGCASRPRRAPQQGQGLRIPRLAEGGSAAPRTDTALRGSLKSGWFILLRALRKRRTREKEPRSTSPSFLCRSWHRVREQGCTRDPVAERESKGIVAWNQVFRGRNYAAEIRVGSPGREEGTQVTPPGLSHGRSTVSLASGN